MIGHRRTSTDPTLPHIVVDDRVVLLLLFCGCERHCGLWWEKTRQFNNDSSNSMWP